MFSGILWISTFWMSGVPTAIVWWIRSNTPSKAEIDIVEILYFKGGVSTPVFNTKLLPDMTGEIGYIWTVLTNLIL